MDTFRNYKAWFLQKGCLLALLALHVVGHGVQGTAVGHLDLAALSVDGLDALAHVRVLALDAGHAAGIVSESCNQQNDNE